MKQYSEELPPQLYSTAQGLQKRQVISVAGAVQRSLNGMFDFMNTEFRATSQINFRDWMYPFVKEHGMTEEEFLEGTSSDFQENNFRKDSTLLRKNSFSFPNKDFVTVLKNIEAFAKEKYPDQDPLDFLETMGIQAGGGVFSDFLLSRLYPRLTGNSLWKSTLYAGAYSAKTTKSRKFSGHFERKRGSNEYIAHLEAAPLPGISTPEQVIRYNSGRIQRVLNHIPHSDFDYEYFPETGKTRFSARGSLQDKETLTTSWGRFFDQLKGIRKVLAEPLDKSMIATRGRQSALKNILGRFETHFKKDLQDMQTYDKTTFMHNIAVGDLTYQLALILGFPQEELMGIAYGASRHDKGKKNVPQSILRDKGKLEAEQFRIMMEHTQFGLISELQFAQEMLNSIFTDTERREIDESFGIGFSERIYQSLRNIITKGAYLMDEHQEMYNGRGYGHRLSKDEISLAGHLIKPIDEIDAFSRSRPYKGERTPRDVIAFARTGIEEERYHPVIGPFVVNFMERLFRAGYSHRMFSESEEGTRLDKLLSASSLGNISWNINVPEEVRDFIDTYKSPEHTPEMLMQRCERNFVGFFDEIRLNELARRFERSVDNRGPSSSLESRLYQSLQRVHSGKIYQVHDLSQDDLNYLKKQRRKMLDDTPLTSETYIADLKEGMSDKLIKLSEMPIEESYKKKD